ncbi:hypothetical protein ANCCAN_15038 [Ancylostoma caninum]|uniref:Uncharacterized protein n=1 Tax=Ancylostoma caninum TaxID=29170 RepID=A0A368G3P4_ANCCA|nr:hypothetical protein ANCCAN_15038 [Ancylostoma caninum]
MASSPWSRCACGPQDFPQGIFQLVSGFVSPQTIKSLTDGMADNICGQKTMQQIIDALMNSLSTKLTVTQWNSLLTLQSNLNSCLKPYGSSVSTVLSKMSSAFQTALSSQYSTLKSYGASLTKSGATCSSVRGSIYAKACPMATAGVVQSCITAAKGKMSSGEWSCVKSKCTSLFRFNLYST